MTHLRSQASDEGRDEASVLYQMVRQLSGSLNVEETVEAAVAAIGQATASRGCWAALIGDDDTLGIHTAVGVEERWRRAFRQRVGEGIAGLVALTGQPRYVPDVHALEDATSFDPAVRSVLVLPLSVHGRVIGTLGIDSERPDAFSAVPEQLVAVAADFVAATIGNARLHAALEQRVTDLTAAHAELREADRLKSEMVRSLSQEIRTPLTFVKGYVELMLTEAAGPLTGEQGQFLTIVADKTNAISRLVDDIGSLPRADEMPRKSQPVLLEELVQQAIRGCASKAAAAGVAVSADLPEDLPLVAGDVGRLLLALGHVVDNAIRFSPAGGTVELKAEDAGRVMELTVADEGIGIPEEEQDRIFDPYYRLAGGRPGSEGPGLGLSIAKRIIEAHGGEMWVESQPGVGSTFHLTLPKYTGDAVE